MALSPPIAAPLLKWYDRHQRRLPWRALKGEKPDPYAVWLSEVMLQQTTVATVKGYFERFLQRWPTVQKLAAATEAEVLAEWAGLGYYSRGRNLHKAAKVIVHERQGQLPLNEAEWRALPGIGPYTAAAISAIAHDQRANVVDGNVERVVARLFAVSQPLPGAKAELTQLAASLLPKRRFGDYAQALMDLGATVCTPRAPGCDLCPLRAQCQAYALGTPQAFPKKTPKKQRPVRQASAFVLVNRQGEVWLRQRPERGLLASMLEVPSSPWEAAPCALAEALASLDASRLPSADRWQQAGEVRHVFTHFELRVTVYRAVCGQKAPVGVWHTPDEAQKKALPTLMAKILACAGNDLAYP